MCTGVEIALVATLAGGLLQAGGKKAEAEQSAALLDYNADVRRMQARDAILRGEEDVRRLRQQVAGLIGSQRAAFAGQGVALDVGTAVEVQADTAALGEADVVTLRNNALREAWGYRTQAKILDYQSSATKKAGTTAALGSLLGTAGNIYSQS